MMIMYGGVENKGELRDKDTGLRRETILEKEYRK